MCLTRKSLLLSHAIAANDFDRREFALNSCKTCLWVVFENSTVPDNILQFPAGCMWNNVVIYRSAPRFFAGPASPPASYYNFATRNYSWVSRQNFINTRGRETLERRAWSVIKTRQTTGSDIISAGEQCSKETGKCRSRYGWKMIKTLSGNTGVYEWWLFRVSINLTDWRKWWKNFVQLVREHRREQPVEMTGLMALAKFERKFDSNREGPVYKKKK